MTDELLTVADVARVVRLTEPTVRAAVRDGELKASKIRGRILIHPDDLAAWVDAGRVTAVGGLPHGVRPAVRDRRAHVDFRERAREMRGAA